MPQWTGFANMADGSWGKASFDPTMLDEPVVDFIARCNRFMTAWCTKAMGGEASNQCSTMVGENDLFVVCVINIKWRIMKNLNLEWIRLFWNRMSEVIRDPVLGPAPSTTLRKFLDKNQVITRGMLSKVIFDRCRETCWYIVQGHTPVVSTTLAQRNDNPTAFEQIRLDWSHFSDALRRSGRILGTAMRMKAYSLKDIVLMMGRNKEAKDDDIADQICLAYGHAMLHGVHLLHGYGMDEVEIMYPLASPGYYSISREEVEKMQKSFG